MQRGLQLLRHAQQVVGLAVAAVALALTGAPAAHAGLIEEGTVRFSVQGRFSLEGPATLTCRSRAGDEYQVPFNASEKATFSARGGRESYNGEVGRSIFFSPYRGRWPKASVHVTRTGQPSDPNCIPNDVRGAPDCGSRAVKGVVHPRFAGGFGARRRYELGMVLSGLREPFENCRLPSRADDGWFGDVIEDISDDSALRHRALRRTPTVRGLYRRRRSTVAGSATKRVRGTVYKLSLKLTVTRNPSRRYRR